MDKNVIININKLKATPLNKELENAEKMIASANSKLNNAEFVSRAPEKVVNIEKDKLEKFTALKASILAELERLG